MTDPIFLLYSLSLLGIGAIPAYWLGWWRRGRNRRIYRDGWHGAVDTRDGRDKFNRMHSR